MAKVRKRTWTNSKGEQTAWVADYTDQEGKRHIKTFDLKREADAWLATTQTEVNAGTHIPDSKTITVAELAALWYQQKQRDGCTRATLYSRGLQITHHIRKRFIGDVKLTELTMAAVNTWSNAIADEVSRVCARYMRVLLKEMLFYAVNNDLLYKNVDTLVPKSPRVRAQKKELRRDIPAKEDVQRLIENAPEGWPRDLISVAAFTGMRQGELRALHFEDLDFAAGGTIDVSHSADKWGTLKAPKSDAGYRRIPMSPHVRETLWRRYCEAAGESQPAVGDPESNVVGLKPHTPTGLIFRGQGNEMLSRGRISQMFNRLQVRLRMTTDLNLDRFRGILGSITYRRAHADFTASVMPVIRELQAEGRLVVRSDHQANRARPSGPNQPSSLEYIARELNRRGIPTFSGTEHRHRGSVNNGAGKWYPSTVKNMIRYDEERHP
jgi:integrase